MKQRLNHLALVVAVFCIGCSVQIPYCVSQSHSHHEEVASFMDGWGTWVCSFCYRANPKENKYCQFCAHWKD